MKLNVKIYRYKPGTEPHYDTFPVEMPEKANVLDAIERAWDDLDRTIMFRHACHHASCGSWGLRVNDQEKLPCVTPVSDYGEGATMDFRFTEDEEAFRREVRQWLKHEIPRRWTELDPGIWEETEESWALAREFQRKLGRKGWLAPAYPREYGGLELSHMKRLILSEELAYSRAPLSIEVEVTANWVGPSIMLFGAEKQKRDYATGLAKGAIKFCLGYSEPNAGSDLASLQTRAVEVGDEYVINGQKTWCSYGHLADYCWLAARTDPDASRHEGISIFIVDMKTPGITVRPLINIVNRHSFNEVFFDDVRIPKENLVGTCGTRTS